MNIGKELKYSKHELLAYFRNRANEILSELSLSYSAADYKKKAKALNTALQQSKKHIIDILLETAKRERWLNADILECILMVTYTNDVVMLETRNSIWEYDYMSFSRRIGELWEPFCKLCFLYPPSNDIRLFVPPLFSEVKQNMSNEIKAYISSLGISIQEKEQLIKYYDKVWNLVTSGEIQLECDLHFTDGQKKYIVDFKSGFGSNEKGNTNRLLLVGSIYHNIEDENFSCIIFVRSTDNNIYLNTLKKSGVWSTYCGQDVYSKIKQYTGYDINAWIKNTINWAIDFSPAMKNAINANKLENYLIW